MHNYYDEVLLPSTSLLILPTSSSSSSPFQFLLPVSSSPRILQRLPGENQVFLQYLLPLLHHITEEEDTNGMNSINLAICFAPTLLWPDSGLDVIKNEVPPLIQFMVEQSPRIFGRKIPDLYRVREILSPPTRSYRVPTKKTDGDLRVYRHRRNGSFDTSTSEDSAGEDDVPSNLVHMHRSGLTVSDSQVSVLSQQLEDEEYDPAISQGVRNVPPDGFHHLSPHSPKRAKKSRPAERSSSYRGPNERPPYANKYHVQVEEARRKSIATQTTLQEASKPRYSTTLSQPSLLSLSSAVSPTSSHPQDVSSFIKSHQMQSFDENEEYNDEDDDLMIVERRSSQKRKRGKPPYRTAFSVDHLRKKTSNSDTVTCYDHLPPLSPKGGESHRPCDLTVLSSPSNEGSFETPMEEDEEERRWMEDTLTSGDGPASLPILPSDRSLTTAHTSNQSINSRSSGSSGGHYYSAGNPKLTQSRPSNLSLVSNASESSYASTVTKTSSPEPERRPLSREMVKYEITRRFHIPSGDNTFTGSTYSNGAGRSDSFNQEMDNIQRKFQERRRPEALGSISSTPSGMGSVVSSPPSFDDRPESERHLNSLPRSEMGFIRSPPPQTQGVVYRRARSSAAETHREVEHNPNKLFVENNSDTESSPSRTLTRRDKLNEVTQRVTRLNSRYPVSHTRVSGSGGTPGRATHRPYMAEITIVPTKDSEQARVGASKAALTQSLPSEPETTKTTITVDMTPSIRPKSADGSDEATVIDEKEVEEEEEEFHKRTLSDIEKAKLKLGLIPPRRRSKSISDTRGGKPLLKDGEGEDEKRRVEFDCPRDEGEGHEMREGRVQAEKMNKRGMWRAHAPNSTDRKEAYTQRMKGSGGSVRAGFTAAKTNVPTAAPPPAIQRTATAPEMGSKRRATTMPEYMATRSSALGCQGRVLGRGLVRTVKITAYHIPEPRKIHRINLRTLH